MHTQPSGSNRQQPARPKLAAGRTYQAGSTVAKIAAVAGTCCRATRGGQLSVPTQTHPCCPC